MKVVCEVEIGEGLPHDILAAAERLIVVAETLRDAAHSMPVTDGAELVRIKEGGCLWLTPCCRRCSGRLI